MITVNNKGLINELYKKYDITTYFSTDIFQDLTLVKFPKKSFICREGESVNYLYFLVDGKVKVNVTQENGKSLLICFLKDFDILGHIEYFAESDYTSTVQALTDVYCFSLNITLLKTKYYNDNVFVRYITQKLANSLVTNVESSSLNLLYPLDTRLATYILLTAEEHVFDENLKHVAEILATSYRHLTRCLTKLCDQGLLKKEATYYRIVEWDRLKRISKP